MPLKRRFTAKNGDRIKDLHKGRHLYRALSMQGIPPDRYIDLWGHKRLYGKIDSDRNPVSLATADVLGTVRQDEENFVQAVDFVADAFSDLKAAYEEKSLKTGELAYLEPVVGYDNPSIKYDSYISALLDVFITSLYSSAEDSKVHNFDDFLVSFMGYVSKIAPITPISKAQFLKSSHCSVMTTGLAIELSTLPHDSDNAKAEKFLYDSNFNLYSSALKQFGFIFDKNAPWRIVADISSSKMQEYMEFYGLVYRPGTSSDLFSKYYFKAGNQDPFLLRENLFSAYRRVLAEKPQYKKNLYCKNTIQRESLLTSNYNDIYWMYKYIQIRMIETNKTISEARIKTILKKAEQKYFYIDLETALGYISNQFPK